MFEPPSLVRGWPGAQGVLVGPLIPTLIHRGYWLADDKEMLSPCTIDLAQGPPAPTHKMNEHRPLWLAATRYQPERSRTFPCARPVGAL